MDNKILGINTDLFWALIFILLLVILGIVSFNYYAFFSGTQRGGVRAGTGFGVSIFPGQDERLPWQNPNVQHPNLPQ